MSIITYGFPSRQRKPRVTPSQGRSSVMAAVILEEHRAYITSLKLYRWLKFFSVVILDTSDDQRSGRPILVTHEFHIEKVKELLNEDK